MLGGYMGRMLWVDMTTRELREEPLDERLARDYVGGYGLAARIAYDRMPAGADPLGPDNILGIVTGPLTGTPTIEGNRFMVTAKSPLTGTWGNANCGGRFGPHLKMAGYDAIFVTGRSEEPLYLYIDEGKAELRSAAHLWGKDTIETEETLQAELGADTQVACIGPAGEKLSLISGVFNDKGRAAARFGVGAVMGSKGLKAVAVRGKLQIPIADPERARALRREYMKRKTPAYDFLSPGTIAGTGVSALNGDSPVRNWGGVGEVEIPTAGQNLSAERILSYQTRKSGCWQCTIACGGHVEVKDGPFKSSGHKPEYETGAAYGVMCLIDDFEVINKCNELCNRYGLDTISAGTAVAFAMECYEHGLITKEDTGGIELAWGSGEAAVALTQMMGERRGIGDLLADGVKRAAERIGRGAEQFAVHVVGCEPGMHDPKLAPTYMVSFVLDDAPGTHMQALYAPGLFAKGIDPAPPRQEMAGTGEFHRTLMALGHVVNCAGVCAFGYMSYEVDFITDFLTAVTGEPWGFERWKLAGERIANIRHLFNLREGHNMAEWTVPGRVAGSPPQQAGPHAGFTVDLETLRKDYFAAMDWDTQTSRPSAERLRRLDMEDLIDAIGAD